MEFSIKRTPDVYVTTGGRIVVQYGSSAQVELAPYEWIVYIKPGVTRVGMRIPLP